MVLIDGYNLLFALFGTEPKQNPTEMENYRSRLVKILDYYFFKKDERCLVVFDGNASDAIFNFPPLPPKTLHDRVQTTFTKNCSADDFIMEYVAAAATPKEITVVTSDSEIENKVSKSVKGVVGSMEFGMRLSEHIEKRKKIKNRGPAEKKPYNMSDSEVERWKKAFGMKSDTIEFEV